MQTLLIAPGLRPGTSLLGLQAPLPALPLLGASLLEYWLAELALNGTTQVMISASDRHESLARLVGTGARWGMETRVIADRKEMSLNEACTRYATLLQEASLLYPAAVLDHLPGCQQPLFEDYAGWFTGVSDWLPQAITPDRVGIRQVRPGIYIAMNAHVSRNAELRGPCWIGEGAFVGARCVVGPDAYLENNCYLEADVEVSQSHIGPNTFLGRYGTFHQTIAWGNILVNWETGATTTVTDAFLIGQMGRKNPTGTMDGPAP